MGLKRKIKYVSLAEMDKMKTQRAIAVEPWTNAWLGSISYAVRLIYCNLLLQCYE